MEDLEHFLGHPHPHPDPSYIGYEGTAHRELYPDNAAVLREVHAQGGIGGYVHPFGLSHRGPDPEPGGARVLGPPQHGAMDSYLFAHANPVFVIADGEPIRSSEDAAFFVRWIERTLADLHAMDRWDDPAHKAEVIATFEEGLRLYHAQAEGS